MRNVQNAVADALTEINASRQIREQVHMDPNNPNRRWIVILTRGEKILEAEVLRGEAHAFAGVLHTHGFTSIFVDRFMDTLMEFLEEEED